MIEVAGKQITTNKISIKDCFADDMWYSIPDYQRPYVWGIDQITALLDDVYYAANNTPDAQYFLGSMVLHCIEKDLDGTEFTENAILDGQQRVTTLYLLNAVIRDLTDNDTRKNTCDGIIYQEGNPDYGVPERYRLNFDIRDEVKAFFDEFVKPREGTLKTERLKEVIRDTKSISIRNMAEAIQIMHDWFRREDDTPDISILFPYLSRFVIMIYVASAELDDAFRLFTVLNDRGIKLRNSDILKAMNLKEASGAKREEYASLWEELEGELMEDFDQFLSYIRTILVKEKARQNLLKEFEESIYKPRKYDATTKKYIKQPPLLNKGDQTFEYLKAYKHHYDKLFSQSNYDVSNNWAFDNLVSVLVDTSLSDIWIPPLMVYRKNFGEQNLYEFFELLDNKFSGDWIARETPTTRIEGMNSIIKEMEHIFGLSISKEDKIAALLKSDVFDFDFGEFVNQITNNTIYNRRYARYLLRKIDHLLRGPVYGEKNTSFAHMSVEHVLPQNPAADSQWVKDYTKDQRDEWTHKLGNLILLSKRKNTSQGRLDFDDKKDKYFKNSVELFPNSVRTMNKNDWKYQTLLDKHNELVKLLSNHYRR